MSRSSDEECMRRLSEGDPGGLGPLHRRYGGPLGSLLLRVEPTLAPEQAEELDQESFITLFQTAARYRELGTLKSWIFRIGLNKARSWRRRTLLRRLLGRQQPRLSAGLGAESSGPDQQAEARLALSRCLQGLSGRQREVLVLRVVEGLTQREVAELLGITENAVATRLHRARSNLGEL